MDITAKCKNALEVIGLAEYLSKQLNYIASICSEDIPDDMKIAKIKVALVMIGILTYEFDAPIETSDPQD